MTFTDNVIKDAFLALEHFLQKVAALDIFEALIFNYKIKVGLLDPLSVNFLSLVSEFSKELQALSGENNHVKGESSPIPSHENTGETAKSTESCTEIPLVLSFCNNEVNDKCLDLVEVPATSEIETQSTNRESDEKVSDDASFECNLEEALNSPISCIVKEERPVDENDETREACNFISAQNDDITEDGDDVKPDLENGSREENKRNKNTTCSFCFKKCPSSLRLEGHLSKCPKARAKHKRRRQSYTCKLCDRRFVSLKSLHSHFLEVHPLSGNGGEATERSSLYRVVEVQSLPENLPFFCCKTCLFVFKTPVDFEIHPCKPIADNRAESEGYVGDYFHLLGKYLVCNPDLLAEMKMFRCGICSEEYRSMNRMLHHLQLCSKGPYPCELCTTEFPTKRELNKHKKMSHGDANSFFCDECGLAFKLRTSLQKHKVNRHETQMDTTCEQCGITFAKRVQLTNHMIKEHQAERNFLCQVCGNKFSTNGSLMVHLTTHSEPSKFACSFCNKKFRQKEKLMFHTKIHTGERPHLCPTCGKGFIRKSKLDEHMRRHRGEKLYHCVPCSKSYASSWDLKLHKRKQHSQVGNSTIITTATTTTTTTTGSNIQLQQQQPQQELMEGELLHVDPDDPPEAASEAPPVAPCGPSVPPDPPVPPVPSAPSAPSTTSAPSVPSVPTTVATPAQNTVAIMPSEQPANILVNELPAETTMTQMTEQLSLAQGAATAVTAAPEGLPHPEGKLLLQLEPSQLPGALLQAAASDATGSRVLLQLGQGGDASSRILVQLDPSHATSAGSQTLLPQSTILAVTDGLQLARILEEMNLNLGGIPTQFIQLQSTSSTAPGQGPGDTTGATATLPMHIQLPVSAVQVPSISQPPSGTQQFSLQPVPVQAVFTPAGFNVNSISY